jgi:hypothetical protein
MAAALPELAGYRTARIAELQGMLAAREGKAGFKRNTQALKSEIARLQGGQDVVPA